MSEQITEEYLQKLACKYLDGTITIEEQKIYDQWYNAQPTEELELSRLFANDRNELKERIFSRLRLHTGPVSADTKNNLFKKYGIAASVIIGLMAMGVYLFKSSTGAQQDQQLTAKVLDAAPGSNKAILTLKNGDKINLTDANIGEVAQLNDVRVKKTASGQLQFDLSQNGSDITTNQSPITANKFNKLETPAGGQYQIILPDGSEVMLNAKSSLSFPERFSGSAREVELNGEGYFKVAKNTRQPFRVTSKGQKVEVLGTQFNINSYSDEVFTTTTLEEGAIRVATESTTKVLSPGKQTLSSSNGKLQVKDANLKATLAWTKGKIFFRDAGIPEIMRQISRWYDVEIKYDGAIPDDRFNGGVSRSSNLSTLLKILDNQNIHCELIEGAKGKVLLVKP